MRHIDFILSNPGDHRIKNKICITLVLNGALILVDKITIKLQSWGIAIQPPSSKDIITAADESVLLGIVTFQLPLEAYQGCVGT
jgi:hypothetical protein